MIPFDIEIMKELRGDTPRQKYLHLIRMKKLLQQIGWPRRGTEEEEWDIFQIAEMARNLVGQLEDLSEGEA